MTTSTVLGYLIYGTTTEADAYLYAAVGDGPTAWQASTDDDGKGRCLVAARRYLDALIWQGTPTVPSQATAWPRTGVTDAYGISRDPNVIPVEITSAQYELAAAYMADPTIFSAARTGSNVRNVLAKGVEVSFFRPTDLPGVATQMPTVAQRLVGQFLSTAVSANGSTYYQQIDDDDDTTDGSTDVESSFDDEATYYRRGPFG
jgi:hypothetical protein